MTSQEAAGQNRRHAKFFDGLVDMIPAQFYHPPEHEVVNTKYLKKNAKTAHKQAMKAQRKQNKRNKLDPNKAKTALGIQKEKAAAAAAAQQPIEAEEQQAVAGNEPQAPAAEQVPAKTLMLPQQAPASKAELSQRLEKRLQVSTVIRQRSKSLFMHCLAAAPHKLLRLGTAMHARLEFCSAAIACITPLTANAADKAVGQQSTRCQL